MANECRRNSTNREKHTYCNIPRKQQKEFDYHRKPSVEHECMPFEEERAPQLVGREHCQSGSPGIDRDEVQRSKSNARHKKILEPQPSESLPTRPSHLPKRNLTNQESFPCCNLSREHQKKFNYNRESSEESECMPFQVERAADPVLKIEPYDMEDVIRRGRRPPQNLPRLPERFVTDERYHRSKAENCQHFEKPKPSSHHHSSHTVDPEMMKVYERGLTPVADPRLPARFSGERPKPDPNKCCCCPSRDQRIPDRFLPPELHARSGNHRNEQRIPERYLRPEGSNTPLCSFMPGDQRIPERFLQHRGSEAQKMYRQDNEKPPCARYNTWNEIR